ncbi:unnamed protein product [Camellia sinensis]
MHRSSHSLIAPIDSQSHSLVLHLHRSTHRSRAASYLICLLCLFALEPFVFRHRTVARSVKLSPCFVKPTFVPHFEVPDLFKLRLLLGCLRFTLSVSVMYRLNDNCTVLLWWGFGP